MREQATAVVRSRKLTWQERVLACVRGSGTFTGVKREHRTANKVRAERYTITKLKTWKDLYSKYIPQRSTAQLDREVKRN